MKKIRAFTAVAFPKELQKDMADAGTTVFAGLSGIRWVKEQAIHLTLKFLGDVLMDDTAEMSDAIREATASFEPFEIKIGGAGTFPPRGRPRIIWVGVDGPGDALPQLFEAIDRAVRPFGINREKKRYHPHVTIGRVKGRIDYDSLAPGMDELNGIDYGTLGVDAVTFYMSDLTPRGPVYTALATIPLGSGL